MSGDVIFHLANGMNAGAAAPQAEAEIIYTKDLQRNQVVRGVLRVVNPSLAVADEAPV